MKCICGLAVHLPLEQPVYFKPGSEEDALLKAESSDSSLLAWFKLNENDNNTHQYLYNYIPNHNTFYNKKWSLRKRDSKKVIGRMYLCSPSEGERFYLRLLLLHVKAAKSYQDLRTFDRVVYTTFKESAKARGLLEDDKEWEKCLDDAKLVQMPKVMRNLFASICIWSHPTDPLFLFNKYKNYLCEDFIHTHNNEKLSLNLCLIELQKYFRVHGKRCMNFGLPEPLNFDYEDSNESININEEKKIASTLYKSLNKDQVVVVDTVMNKVSFFQPDNKNAFFCDGPGLHFFKLLIINHFHIYILFLFYRWYW